MAKERKLLKSIEGNIVKIKEVTTGKELAYDFAKLPADIKEKFGPFGLGHKLGDAAAGEAGQTAIDSINKVWDGLMAGNWAVKGTRGESISLSVVQTGLEALPEKERVAAKLLMLKLGIVKPSSVEDFNFLLSIKKITPEVAKAGIDALAAAK